MRKVAYIGLFFLNLLTTGNISVGNRKKQAHAGYGTRDGRYFYIVNLEDNIWLGLTLPIWKCYQ